MNLKRRSPTQATIIKPEQALAIKPFGLDMKVLLTTEATGGATSVIVGRHKPGEGPPDHVHFTQEEVFFILEGTYELTVGGQTATAGPGTIVFIPRKVVEPSWWTGSLLQSDLRPRRRRRLHRREGDGDQPEVRHELPCSGVIR